MKITKVKLTIERNTVAGEKISNFMSRMDLGISEVMPFPMIIEMETKSKVDKKYKERLKKEMTEKFKDELIIKDIKFEIIKQL